MDHYLSASNTYNRLEEEYIKYGKLIIAVDFDDTLYDFHQKGRSYECVAELLREWKNHAEIIVWTASHETRFPMITNYLNERNIPYHGINCDSTLAYSNAGRKIYANVYLDDRAGLYEMYCHLTVLIGKIKRGELDMDMNRFNAKKVKNEIVQWIQDFFSENGPGCNSVVGISGGKDSSVAAALCVEALGKDRVIGVLMPQGVQSDISYSQLLVQHLDIRNETVNIGGTVSELRSEIQWGTNTIMTEQAVINLPARIRMATLYAISQSNNGRVVNTCNLSEDWVGYATRYGDGAGDFSPLADLTTEEICEIGRELGLPEALIEKVPTDGLCGKTDEENLGFTYEVLNKYIRTGVCEDVTIKEKIDIMHEKNKFKLELMPKFEYKE